MANANDNKKPSNDIKGTKIGSSWKLFKKTVYEKKNILLAAAAISFMIFTVIIGYIVTSGEKSRRLIRDITFGGILSNGLSRFYISLLLTAVVVFYVARKLRRYVNESYVDEEKDIKISKHNTEGGNERMKDGAEKEECFISSMGVSSKDLIFGRDIDHPEKTLTLNQIFGINSNILVIGPPGSGKTRCFVIPALFQIMRRGESCICTDAKAEIYGMIKVMAEKYYGYKTCFINFDEDNFAHSDGVDLFKVATKSDLKCSNFAETIVDNFGSKAETGFWRDAAVNLLAAVMLYVKNDTTGSTEKTLSGVAKMLNRNNPAQLIEKFQAAESSYPDSQMIACAHVWIGGTEATRNSSYAQLSQKLTRLINKTVARVTSENEVDMELPGKEKCLYFINLSPQSRSMDFLSALFFDEIITTLYQLAMKSPGKRLPVTCNLLFEEFANIGKMPYWTSRMNTLRSQGLPVMMIIQNLNQIESLYESDAANITSACSLQILLGANDSKTAKEWSDRSGTMTTIKESYAYEENKDRIVKDTQQSVRKSVSEGKRAVYTTGDIFTLRYPRELVSVQGFNICEMERLDMSNHPMMQEVIKIDATKHYPEWLKTIDPREYEQYEIAEQMKSKEFLTDAEMIAEAYPNGEPNYKCDKDEFMSFYHPKNSVMVNKNDESEKILETKQRKLDRYREENGESSTLVEVADTAKDLFGDDESGGWE